MEQVFTIRVSPGELHEALERIGGHRRVVLELAAGTHHVARPVVLDARVLGICEGLTIVGAGREDTILTGYIPLECGWTQRRGEIRIADVPADLLMDGLYADGRKQVLARYPNLRTGEALDGYAVDAISPERVAGWRNPAGGYIRALHGHEWGGNDFIITGKGPDGALTYEWVGDNNRGDGMHPYKRMVENILEELDSPGEWYYDKDRGKLHYWPEPGVDPGAARFEAAVNPRIFHIRGGDGQSPSCAVEIRHMTIARTPRTLFTGAHERHLRGDWAIVRDGAILLENAANVRIFDVHFDDIGGNAVAVSGYNAGHEIVGNDFTHIGASGVMISGLTGAVRDPSHFDGDQHKTTISDYTPGPLTEDYPRDILIKDNWFYDIGACELQAAAVHLSICSRVTIRRNTIHHTTRAGININDGCFGGHLIEGNDLFDCVTHTADHGPINAWGRDRFWSVPKYDTSGKYGREKRPFALLDAWETSVVRNNRIHANHAFGLDFDDGASNYDIYNNLCIGVGIKLREGFDRKVHNNLLIGSGFEVHVSYAQNNDLFYTNVVVNRKIVNFIAVNEGATTAFNGNLYWEPESKGGALRGLPEEDFGSAVADPLFADFAGNDFSLLEDSPALSMGFVPFPASDRDFGRPDCPKPPPFRYAVAGADVRQIWFHDVLLSDIGGEGMRSAAGLPDMRGVFILDRAVLGIFTSLGLPIGAGDVVRRIGETEIGGIDDFLRGMEAVRPNEPVTLMWFRNQSLQSCEFVASKPIAIHTAPAQ